MDVCGRDFAWRLKARKEDCPFLKAAFPFFEIVMLIVDFDHSTKAVVKATLSLNNAHALFP